jgi:hypothetical protein
MFLRTTQPEEHGAIMLEKNLKMPAPGRYKHTALQIA